MPTKPGFVNILLFKTNIIHRILKIGSEVKSQFFGLDNLILIIDFGTVIITRYAISYYYII